MKILKRKTLAALLALSLLASLLPLGAQPAQATENVPATLLVGGTDVKSGGYWTTDTDGKLTECNDSTEPPATWNVHYDASNNTLNLDGATIMGNSDGSSVSYGIGIYASSSSEDVSLNINLQGENTITSGTMGIYVLASSNSTGDASLTITGNGSLTTEGSGYGSHSGILVQSNAGNANLTINNVDVTATNSNTQAIRLQPSASASATLAVNSGSLTASGSKGINYLFGTGLTGNGTPTVTVSGNAVVDAKNGGIANNSSSPIQYGTGSSTTGGIVFDGNTGTVYGDVELKENLKIGEGESLTLGTRPVSSCRMERL